MRTVVVQHPLVAHKLTTLRDETTDSATFRLLVEELVTLLAYEATADFPLEATTIDCWSGPTEVQRIAGRTGRLMIV